ncbi:hypothetical protein JOF29_005717 [Kribbella aluminosa]|uniref:Uncharacterized protein n=1 Tax=Kribbella aluminosa TaxID=416017 RepID=A0ABS4USI7_9ACTN|nr:hypothetical protein [Kribbella aluminosa]MBP2354607.1 hypothetical protein [Kribbella aluminosa]
MKGKVISWRATTKFRDLDGRVREVTAFEDQSAAEHRLLTKLRDRAKTTQGGELKSTHKIKELIDLWIEKSRSASRTVGDHRCR